ncbi:NfeD family protein [Anthocerotibacter panamensis]|uniref:NfeD family protein n=1 Tax=Anthocerotibacter panamensis TaxID=2857077 RepID=UPI001C405DC6|nr:NfeD family protein [Anthocerotibacter panamensis]
MNLSPALIWLLLGVALWVLEALTPAQVAGAAGTAALMVALLSPVLPGWPVQFFVFAVFSGVLVWAARRFLSAKGYRDPLEQEERGRAVTAIVPGQAGRVSMGGTTWNARCELPGVTVSPGEEVFIVRREGTTLVVMPMNILKES